MSHWAAEVIGRPWMPGARGPRAFDCRGLTEWAVRRRHGVELPEVENVRDSPWRRVDGPPMDGDVVLMNGPDGRHIGLMVWANRILGVLHANGTVDRETGRPRGCVVFQDLKEATADGYHDYSFWRLS